MSEILSPEILSSVQQFVSALKIDKNLIFHDSLGFFREYLQSIGARIPVKPSEKASGDSGPTPTTESKVEDMEEEEAEEPYPEIDNEGVIEPDPQDLDQEMGNPDEAATDEDIEKSNEAKSEAVRLYAEGNFEGAVAKYTEAIKLNGGSSILFAKRGQAFLQLNKPNACIKDCNRALQINPDSAIAYKFRGRAHRLLGNWENAAKDLRQACKIDFDDQADAWLKEVQPNARKLEEWRLRKKRRDEEREIKLRKLRAQERAKAHSEARSAPQFEAEPEGEGGANPSDFFGSVPGLDKVMNDPEILELFSDPEVSAAFADVGKNPMNILKYQSNPKVAKLLSILKSKMGGMGGMGGGMGGMGGMGGFPGFGGGMPGGFPGGPGGAPGDGFEDASDQVPKPPTNTADDLD